MKAIVHHGSGLAGVKLAEMTVPPLGARDVRVSLKAAALNHRDIWSCLRRTPADPPVVLGSDGAGIVDAVGPEADRFKPGDEVVINGFQDWLSVSHVPSGEYGVGYKILGNPDHGTFAEAIVISCDQLEPKPAYLGFDEAAALSLVGLTTYRALFTQGGLKAGQTVVVPGIGGGAATQALLFAKCAGARVVVTSRAEEKLDRARALGADLALATDGDWESAVRDFTSGRGADLVIDSVGNAVWAKALSCLRNGGKLVSFGATSPGMVELDLPSVFLRWKSIIGTTMGSRDEFRDMLAFAAAYQVRPVIDRRFRLEQGAEALGYLDSAQQMGKVVLEIGV
jgi:zinc-binding alcohol dehydrogenase/oxidoreductase